eukprot:TRINITY_DN28190_c0_g1_i1.p1 TRINITY_DN28190_c0_g1~~TRINITY_DN28190_c0_g1_i1.p1  ORF type:complete len:170 (+),score=19.62 TRINITY_DN28190_c0_g1_i1:297-806(+)
MLTVYPPGRDACFKRHLDNPEGDGRVITAMYYTNQQWSVEDGALLRAWTNGQDSVDDCLEIVPEADRLVLFYADRISHEVTPNKRQDLCIEAHRCAMALWFYSEDQAVAHLQPSKPMRWPRRKRCERKPPDRIDQEPRRHRQRRSSGSSSDDVVAGEAAAQLLPEIQVT